MKLIDIESGQEVLLHDDLKLLVVNGVNIGEVFPVKEIVPPNDKWPEGLLKSKQIGLGWQQYAPSVFNMRIEVETEETKPEGYGFRAFPDDN